MRTSAQAAATTIPNLIYSAKQWDESCWRKGGSGSFTADQPYLHLT